MLQTIMFVTDFLAIGTVFSQIFILILILLYLYTRKQKSTKAFELVKKNSQLLAFAVALGGVLASLFYSEYAGYAPCELCWYQRIAIYPMVLLLGYGIIKKDKAASKYTMLLAIAGLLIAIYHYILQFLTTKNINVEALAPCEIGGAGPSCTDFYILKFGYITIPMMSITALVLIILLLLPSLTKIKR